MNSTTILSVKNLKKDYSIKKMFKAPKVLHALNGVSFDLAIGETLGIVGESGCGKSTLAKVLTKLEEITEGSINLDGQVIQSISDKHFHSLIQMVFQDPYQSLNPRKTAFDIIADPLYINENLSKMEIKTKVMEAMQKVGLRPEFAKRYPHQFSGGQRQRLGIARALMLNPKILILDEPVSALDVSIQAQVLNLLLDIQKEFNLSYLFISHDLSVIAHMSDKIIVMYLGKVVEYGTRDQIFNSPMHPYTQILLESSPHLHQTGSEKKLASKNDIKGELPSPFNLPSGCAFQNRCPKVTEDCRKGNIELSKAIDGRLIACSNI